MIIIYPTLSSCLELRESLDTEFWLRLMTSFVVHFCFAKSSFHHGALPSLSVLSWHLYSKDSLLAIILIVFSIPGMDLRCLWWILTWRLTLICSPTGSGLMPITKHMRLWRDTHFPIGVAISGDDIAISTTSFLTALQKVDSLIKLKICVSVPTRCSNSLNPSCWY